MIIGITLIEHSNSLLQSIGFMFWFPLPLILLNRIHHSPFDGMNELHAGHCANRACLVWHMLSSCACFCSVVKRAAASTQELLSLLQHRDCICQGLVKWEIKENWSLCRTASFCHFKYFDSESERKKGSILDTENTLKKPHEKVLCCFNICADGQLPDL